MNVKLDTKERFTVITPNEAILTAIMTEELCELLLTHLEKDIPHVILNMKPVVEMEKSSAWQLMNTQLKFYQNDASFVICELNKNIENTLKPDDELTTLNLTPTESEAWDILQMEEIERELFNEDD